MTNIFEKTTIIDVWNSLFLLQCYRTTLSHLECLILPGSFLFPFKLINKVRYCSDLFILVNERIDSIPQNKHWHVQNQILISINPFPLSKFSYSGPGSSTRLSRILQYSLEILPKQLLTNNRQGLKIIVNPPHVSKENSSKAQNQETFSYHGIKKR